MKAKTIKEFTFDDVIEIRDEQREKIRIIIEYLLNKNSKRDGIDYKQFYEDIEDLETYLLN